MIGGYRPQPYDALLLATPLSVRLVMVDGRALFGDVQLVAAGPSAPGCESLALCGTSKFLCAAESSTEQFRQAWSLPWGIVRSWTLPTLVPFWLAKRTGMEG